MPLAELARVTARGLGMASAPAPSSLALVMSDDRELSELNRWHMGDDGPTDVLSFPLLEMREGRVIGDTGGARPPGHRLHLGDIVISVERAIEQATAGRGGQTGDVRWSAADELRLLVVHGVLHVLGWDHADGDEERRMRTLERLILEAR